MSTYLTRKDGRYLYRRRFPKAVADAIGRVEMKRALGTADRAEALKLSRALSVEFDRVCEDALAPAQITPTEAPAAPALLSADEIMQQMQDAIRRVQRDALERMQSPGWQGEFEWQRQALKAHAAGKMPPGVQMHPVIAQAALKALDDVQKGTLYGGGGSGEIVQPRPPIGAPVASEVAGEGRATQAEFELALEQYCVGKSKSRKSQARNVSAAVLRFPCTPAEAEAQILQHLTTKLAEGGRASTLRTSSTLLFAILKWLPGFENLALPKRHPTTEALRGETLDVEARASVPRDLLVQAIRTFQETGDEVSAAAFRVLALYGMRPSELLREGRDSIQLRKDVLGNVETVFVAGLTMRKTRGSKRSLPIHRDDLPLFETVHAALGLADDCTLDEREHRGRIRSNELAKRFRRLLSADVRARYSLYGVRHLFADLARAAGATEEETGLLLGHTAKGGSKVTGIYGGSGSLDRAKEILAGVRELLAQDGTGKART